MNTALLPPSSPVKLPPMLLQYKEYKSLYPDCLLLFQVGDFYEVFFDDAVVVSRTLNLTLTSRDKNNPEPVPMCGVPCGVVDAYVERLVEARFSVAIVSQVGGPVVGKGTFERRLERIVTPAVRVLAGPRADRRAGLVGALVEAESGSSFSLVYSDIQSGKVFVRDSIQQNELARELKRFEICELLLPKRGNDRGFDRRAALVKELEASSRDISIIFRSEIVGATARQLQGVVGYAGVSPYARNALRLLVEYLDEITVSSHIPFVEICESNDAETLLLDSMTRANLELTQNTVDGGARGTLYEYLDRTCSSGGSRQMREWIIRPLARHDLIVQRLDAVEAFVTERELRKRARAILASVDDLSRIALRIELGVVTPRELGNLRDCVRQLPELQQICRHLCSQASTQPAVVLQEIAQATVVSDELVQDLSDWLAETLPLTLDDGGVIRVGQHAELDRLRQIGSDGDSFLREMEQREKQRTGISSLKIKYTSVFGYFIEITRAHLEKVPTDYVRRQTTVSSERFITEELKRFEGEALGAQAKIESLERQLYQELRARCRKFCSEIRKVAQVLSTIDALASLAEVAEHAQLVRPSLTTGTDLKVQAGRHPVVEQLLKGRFVPNTINLLDSDTTLLVTGPNMGGKSTFLRQAGLIVVMAHLGSFVPAESVEVGVVDALFARLGASDNQLEGESTFMVEMNEASQILSHATKRSLVLIDEIGRGTSTTDGRALAQAILESLASGIRCRTIFATHFHELTLLENVIPAIKNISVQAVEQDGHVVFTHELQAGPASRSYGLEVAELAGIPAEVVDRARCLVQYIIQTDTAVRSNAPASQQLNFFSATSSETKKLKRELEALRAKISAVNIDTMTPLQAMTFLQSLKSECA